MAEILYAAPSSLEMTLQLLKHAKYPALPLAGGTRLLPDVRANNIQTAALIDLRYLDILKGIWLENDGIEIGARMTLAELEHSPLLQEKLPLLTKMSKSFASPLVRSSATIGGNIVSCNPVADAVVPLLALNATLSLQAVDGEAWKLPLASFLTIHTHVPFHALVTRVSVLLASGVTNDGFWFYHKLGQWQPGAVSVASVAIALMTDLQEPRGDLWASATYRVKMGQALIKKALKQLNTLEKAR